jgi:hypothetical protein
MIGIINKDGSVIGNDNNTYYLPVRGMDKEGYIEILIDAKHIGYSGSFHRQSIKPFIGMKVEFVPNGKGYNYKIHTP